MDVDSALVRACQKGEPGALDALISATYADVYRLCRRMLVDQDEAADATQEVFIRVMRSVLGFREESTFGTWLYRVAVNVCLSALRRRSRATAVGAVPSSQPFAIPGDLVSERIAGADAGPDERAETADLARRAEAAVARLPEPARAVVVLRDLEGWSTQEVAQLLGLSENVVKVRLCRAHARLRRELAGPGPSAAAGGER
jgi:RNA polymerase sigma-70 factor (ECF subfamily)